MTNTLQDLPCPPNPGLRDLLLELLAEASCPILWRDQDNLDSDDIIITRQDLNTEVGCLLTPPGHTPSHNLADLAQAGLRLTVLIRTAIDNNNLCGHHLMHKVNTLEQKCLSMGCCKNTIWNI